MENIDRRIGRHRNTLNGRVSMIPMNQTIENITVIGLGLIGASFAAAFTSSRPSARVFGVDVSAESIEKARKAGWICGGSTPDDPSFREFVMTGNLSDDAGKAVGEAAFHTCDLVMIAVPVDAAEGYLKKLASWGYPNIITDTASTKARIVEMAERNLLYPERYIPGHPMAGSEKNGIDGANPRLFAGAHWILCPDARTPEAYYPQMHAMLTGIGARVINMPREDHDQAVAVVSHVPHIVASSLVRLAYQHAEDEGDAGVFRLAAGGFKDSTRIAAGSPGLWSGILTDNADAILKNLDAFQGIISRFQEALRASRDEGDRTKLHRLLEKSSEVRKSVPARWLPDTERMYEARISMENRPGSVARIVSAASELGCNIQSIDIDHITSSTAVLSLVLTDEGDRERLKETLDGWGYPTSIEPLSAKEYRHADE